MHGSPQGVNASKRNSFCYLVLVISHRTAPVTPCLFSSHHLHWLAPQKRKLLPTHLPYGLFGPVIIQHLIKLNGFWGLPCKIKTHVIILTPEWLNHMEAHHSQTCCSPLIKPQPLDMIRVYFDSQVALLQYSYSWRKNSSASIMPQLIFSQTFCCTVYLFVSTTALVLGFLNKNTILISFSCFSFPLQHVIFLNRHRQLLAFWQLFNVIFFNNSRNLLGLNCSPRSSVDDLIWR